MEVVYKDVKIIITLGDLLEENTEAIVNPANSLMLMGGGVAGIIKRKGGEEIENEAKKYAPVPIGKAILTTAGKLKQKYVIHSPTVEYPASLTNYENVYKATKAAIIEAYNNRINSIAFPAMGTGVGGLSYDLASKAMIKAIKDSIDEGFSCKLIKITLINKEAYDEFVKNLEILK